MDINMNYGIKIGKTEQAETILLKSTAKQDSQECEDVNFNNPVPVERIIHMSCYGLDVKTKLPNPKNPKEYLTMNEVAYMLATEGEASLKQVKGLTYQKIPSGNGSIMYDFGDFAVMPDKNDLITVMFTDNKGFLKIQYRKPEVLNDAIRYLHSHISKEFMQVEE